MIQIAKIKINGTRSIELLSQKKNPQAEHIKIGNYYGELTEDKSKTNGNPTLVFNKNGKRQYIREKFKRNIYQILDEFGTKSGSPKDFELTEPFTIKNGILRMEISYNSSGSGQIYSYGSVEISIPKYGIKENIQLLSLNWQKTIDCTVNTIGSDYMLGTVKVIAPSFTASVEDSPSSGTANAYIKFILIGEAEEQ